MSCWDISRDDVTLKSQRGGNLYIMSIASLEITVGCLSSRKNHSINVLCTTDCHGMDIQDHANIIKPTTGRRYDELGRGDWGWEEAKARKEIIECVAAGGTE